MDCIFKVYGYVPRHRVCTHCEPLEHLFKSLNNDGKKNSRAIDLILRTYTVLKADDVLRDETSKTKKALARLIKAFYSIRLPNELKCIARKADTTIRAIEASDINEEEYIKHVSTIGGEVFQSSMRDKRAFSIGKTLSSAITIHDMVKDLQEDKRTNHFNPLKVVPQDKLATKIAALQISLPNIGPNSRNIRMYNPKSELASNGCHESFNICFGVCLGICSAILAYRCCCNG